MKTVRSKTGPFQERPHFKEGEIERMCTDELKKTGLYPSQPESIRIDRFIEKRFGIVPRYAELPNGVLGFTEFGPEGVKEIVVAAALDADPGTPSERRLRTTLAHEAGHGLLHAHLFALGKKPAQLFEETDDTPHILCRDLPGEGKVVRGYDGKWWEYQANKAIGGLLLPRRLVELALQGFTTQIGTLGQLTIPSEKRELAAHELARIFNVNPAATRIRIEEMMPSKNERQLSL